MKQEAIMEMHLLKRPAKKGREERDLALETTTTAVEAIQEERSLTSITNINTAASIRRRVGILARTVSQIEALRERRATIRVRLMKTEGINRSILRSLLGDRKKL
jgi:hypothetical protein